MRFSYGLFIAVILAMAICSCRQRGDKHIKQGEIHYNIDYIGTIGPMPREVLPKDLVVSFKDNKILFELLSSWGNSGIFNLSNPEKGIVDTYFSLFTIKYFYPVKPGELYPGFEAMKDIKIKKTHRTSVICGFDCKSAEVTIPGQEERKIEIWYTNEIAVKNPNIATPFKDIDGVLMKFFFIFGSSEMHFNAETVYKKSISDETFERRPKFIKVSREQIDKFINKLTST